MHPDDKQRIFTKLDHGGEIAMTYGDLDGPPKASGPDEARKLAEGDNATAKNQ